MHRSIGIEPLPDFALIEIALARAASLRVPNP